MEEAIRLCCDSVRPGILVADDPHAGIPEVIKLELVVVLAAILAMLGIDKAINIRGVRRDRKMAHTVPLPAGALAILNYDDAEDALTALLLAGQLDRVDYRDTMAALAATERTVTGVDPLPLIAMDRDAVEHLWELGIAMPALPHATLSAAVALAHNGASAENLTRLLGLTEAEAVQVILMMGIT